ncbi:uncharacterized protein [Typha latifolia]|uniref:uncharacterized protein isoform X1 n=1 Tax=Typha latifolia TaxID=4733 RepID=UPI003C2BAABB
MVTEGKDVMLHIRKVLTLSIRTSYISARDHPVVFTMGLMLITLYILFPTISAFLFSSCPVIVCTTLLLGALLSYGEPNIPEIEEKDAKSRKTSSLNAGISINGLCVKPDESGVVQTSMEIRPEIQEMVAGERVFGEGTKSAHCKEEDYEQDKDDYSLAAISSLQDKIEETDIANKVNEGQAHHQEIAENIEISLKKGTDRVLGEGKFDDGVFAATNIKEVESLKIENNKSSWGNQSDFFSPSTWQQSDSHGTSSESESDLAESSSPDASMADIIPMLDELNQPALICNGNSDFSSKCSSDEHDLDDHIEQEETETHKAKEDRGEEKKDDGNEDAVAWTAEDQKNVMDLGPSELERNRRLERLIAKRRAKKSLSFRYEKNLIDMDSDDSVSCIHIQVPPISAPRRNPFDLLYDPEEAGGLPPIPGSAPSIMLPRRDPFDLPYDQLNESSSFAQETWSPCELMPVEQQDMFFRRQEKHASRLKPDFVTEKMHSEEVSFATFWRQFSDKSDPKMTYVTESDTVSSVTNEDYHKDLIEGHHLKGDLPSSKDGAELAKHENNTLLVADTLSSETEKRGKIAIDHHESLINGTMVVQEAQQIFQLFESLEERNNKEISATSTISDDEELHVIEKECHYQVANAEILGNCTPSADAHYDLLSLSDRFNDNQLADVIYDSRPPEIDISLSNISALDALSFNAGAGSLDASSTLDSSNEVSFSDAYISSGIVQDNTSSGIPLKLQPPSEASIEISQVSIMGLHSLHEEKIEDFNLREDHESMIYSDSVVGLTGLQIIGEENIATSDTEEAIINVVQGKQDGNSGKYLNDSDEECNNFHPDLITKEIDEKFLLELDAVGDFHVEELRSGQENSDLKLQTDVPSNGFVSDFCYAAVHDIPSELYLNNYETLNSSFNQQKTSGSEIRTSFGPLARDSEQTLYNPKLHVLETSSIGGINLFFEQLHEEEHVPYVSKSIFGKSSTAKPEVSPSELGPELRETDLEMIVLEVKSIEEIDSVFKQLSEGLETSDISEVVSSQATPGGMDLESLESRSNMQISSVEDLSRDGSGRIEGNEGT